MSTLKDLVDDVKRLLSSSKEEELNNPVKRLELRRFRWSDISHVYTSAILPGCQPEGEPTMITEHLGDGLMRYFHWDFNRGQWYYEKETREKIYPECAKY